MTEARYDNIASDGRPVPFPQKAVSEIRRRKAAEKAQEAARSSGCPCIMKGYVGEDDAQHITLDTKIMFEWLHVRKRNGDPHVCQISYRNLISLGRPVPNSPVLLHGRQASFTRSIFSVTSRGTFAKVYAFVIVCTKVRICVQRDACLPEA